MAIRGQEKIETIALIPGMHIELNPYAQSNAVARIMRNFILDKTRMRRWPYNPIFGTTVAFSNWDARNFRYTRAGAPENKFIIVGNDGKLYDKKPSKIQEIFPGTTSFSALVKRPFIEQLSNRLFFCDGSVSGKYVYDGRSFRQWGLTRSTTAPAVTAANVAGSIVAATGVKGCFTWVVLDEAGNRVHESSRSNINASFVVIGGADDAVTLDITGLTAPSGATHWSGYISELDGSEVYRRTNTTLLTTFTYTATAFPASTSPKAPIRNDPPPQSTVGCVAKNRIFLRDDAAPSTLYFSALGEVKGLLNGAPDESFCGYGTNSISDISNSDFVPDREIRAMIEHDNAIFIFTERAGYALIGEFNLLDNRSPRSIVKIKQFNVGCVGPHAIISTPYGLIWMTPARRLVLWNGTSELQDIGEPVQQTFDSFLPEFGVAGGTFVDRMHMAWWDGGGKQWLIIIGRWQSSEDAAVGSPGGSTRRMIVYDFNFPVQRPSRSMPEPGTWVEYLATTGADEQPDCVGIFQDDDGMKFLVLFGYGTGRVLLADTSFPSIPLNATTQGVGAFCPAHLNYTAKLGSCYLGSTVQGIPLSTIRSGLIFPNANKWCIGNYISLTTGTSVSPGTPAAGSFTEPAVRMVVDAEDPAIIGTYSTLTLDTALTSSERRAWMIPQPVGAGNNVNIGGAFGRNFVFEVSFADTGNTEDVDPEGANRLTPREQCIYKMGLTFERLKEMNR